MLSGTRAASGRGAVSGIPRRSGQGAFNTIGEIVLPDSQKMI